MNQQVKIDAIVSLIESFPAAFNHLNLAGNREFIDWFMPRLDALRESDFWDEKVIEEIQTRRLQNLLSYLQQTSPFWKQRLDAFGIRPESASILKDLKLLPVTDYELFAEEKGAYAIPRGEPQPVIHTRYSSGTTGRNKMILISDPEISLDILSCLFRKPIFDAVAIRKMLERKFFLFLGRTVLPHYASFASSFPLDNYTRLSDPDTRNEIYRILKTSPQILWAFSSIAYEFAHYRLVDDSPPSPLLAIYIHSESSTCEEKLFIKNTFNVPVVHLYISCETAIIGDECSSYFGYGYYHIPRERTIIEIVDENGSPVNDHQEGRIVVTILDRKITPIIRYANGDRGKFPKITCACGKKSPLLEVRGREGENIKLPSGKTFSALLFASIFLDAVSLKTVSQYQIQQESLKEIIIRVVPAAESLKAREIAAIELLLSSTVGKGVSARIVHVESIPREPSGKMRFFVPLKKNE
ncbi:MAG: hypothetical protein UV98_C0004G0009 [Parcubacteria group bacterium GW2011_GWB1_43_6]|nr:MAG: hypothetical protein UV98_C0004G0009 [Parcubacteria group bacterium GW2011_GWB1_43_6]